MLLKPAPRSHWVASYFAVWTALALAFSLQSLLYAIQAGRPFEVGAAVLSSMFYWYLWGALGLAVLRLAARFPIDAQHPRRHAMVHLVLGVLVAGTHVLLRTAAERLVNGNSSDGLQAFFVEQFHLDLLVYWGIVGASHAITFHRQAIARAADAGVLASRAANLEAMVATARLNALRAQLEPHFLFNTLQAVSTLMREDVALADRTLGQLSTLLRRIVDAADVQEVPLADELELAGAYLEIQSIRFQTQLSVETHVEPGVAQALVPILVMQPLIENACLHGISRRPNGGRVILRATQAGDRAGFLRLSVTNDGPEAPRSPEQPTPTAGRREGVGLSNTRKRLEVLYGERQTIAMKPGPGGLMETVIEIPLHWPSAGEPATSAGREPVHG